MTDRQFVIKHFPRATILRRKGFFQILKRRTYKKPTDVIEWGVNSPVAWENARKQIERDLKYDKKKYLLN